MDFGIGSVTAITAICYLGGMACKATTKVKDEVIPVCDQRCSHWHCIRSGSNRSAPGHQTGKQEVEGGDPTISRRQSGSWLPFATSQ